MSNKEHLTRLIEGIESWNEWRKANPLVAPDLRHAKLSAANLVGANLSRVELFGANLSRAKLSQADLSRTELFGVDLSEAVLIESNLSQAILGQPLFVADLRRADLRRANLSGAILREVNLSRAILNGANLSEAVLSGANLSGAILTDSQMGLTKIGSIDLSEVKGLETVQHWGPSTVGIDTIFHSQAKIPELFLRAAGVPEVFITNMPSLVAAMSPIDFYSCFISYSGKDQEFAKRLYGDLQTEGVRCWYAPEDLRIGDKFRQRIDDAIRFHDKLLVVLSENSVASSWVEKEVETAFEKERTLANKIVLFPIRLDEAVMKTSKAWTADIRRTRHIGDFSNWHDHSSYQKAFQRLLRDLKGDKGAGVTAS